MIGDKMFKCSFRSNSLNNSLFKRKMQIENLNITKAFDGRVVQMIWRKDRADQQQERQTC